jgi:dynein heavy chain, axonemal
LPTDDFSKENGVFINQGLRWALNIDPQSQANQWIKNLYGNSLKIADPKEKKYLDKIREAVINGHTILLQDIVSETLDPTLDNVLNKNITKTSNARKESYTVKFGTDEITYDINFRLLMTTRMPNPHYTPEVSTKVAVINFTVVVAGLEEQCLGIVVKAESP